MGTFKLIYHLALAVLLWWRSCVAKKQSSLMLSKVLLLASSLVLLRVIVQLQPNEMVKTCFGVVFLCYAFFTLVYWVKFNVGRSLRRNSR